jgi:hypothetical protein
METVWTAQPGPQTEFVARADFEVGYGGAAGGGKTDGIIGAVARDVDKPFYRAVIFRRTNPEITAGGGLLDRTYAIYRPLGAEWKDAGEKKYWAFPSGARIYLRHLEHEKTVHSYQGSQFHRVAFDECTQFTEFQYKYMMSRIRRNIPEINCQLLSATNPGGIGHMWYRGRFEPYDPYRILRDPETGLTRVFIPARVYDNKYFNPNSAECTDPLYVQRLMMLPEAERKKLLEGNWDIFEGQFFYRFNANVHIVDPFSIPTYWEKVRAIDYGYFDPTCCLWLAMDWSEDPVLYVYKEYYQATESPINNARRIVELSKNEEYAKTVAGPDAWAKKPQRDEEEPLYSPVDMWEDGGLRGVMKAVNDRHAGWAAVRQLIEWDGVWPNVKRLPNLRIFRTCANLIRTLPGLICAQNDPEDIEKAQEDHAPDALRYGCLHFYDRLKGKKERQLKDRYNVARIKEKIIQKGYLLR